MKFSSWLAVGALIGRELCPGKGKRNWKDAVLAAIIAKNELVDKDGEVRKRIEQGTSDSDIKEMEETLAREIAKQEKIRQMPRERGFWAAFKRGYAGEKR